MPPTTANGRCSMAPAAVFATVGESRADRWRGQHHAGDTGTLGAAQQGAQVAGIGDPGRDEEERLHALTARGTQLLQRDRLDRPGQREHTLRRFGPRLRVETMTRHRLDGNAEPGRQLLYAVQLR